MSRYLPVSAWPVIFLLFALLGLLDLLSPAVGADKLPAPTPPTLAQALADAEPPEAVLLLTVGAEQVALPKEAVMPPKGTEVAVVASTYERITQEFGDVKAIAPPTMTLLNTDPGTPNPYDGMPPADALKMLLGTLTDAQWKALTGSQGLGISSLTTDVQWQLYQALFPGESVTLHPQHDAGNGTPQDWAHLPKLTHADLMQATLRLGQRVMVGIPVAGKSEWMNSPPEAADGKPQYEIYGGGGDRSKDTLYGVTVRQDAPNTLKASDLDFAEKRWEQPVKLEGVKTVGDLVARIGLTTRTELYADRRLEKRTVLWISPTSRPSASAQAKDLLKALALCVAGAYRKVGPAYVLTNDVMGVGTRRSILSRFAQAADIARHAALLEATDTFIQAHGGIDDLPTLDAQRSFSDAQKQAAQDSRSPYRDLGQGMQLEVPMDQLTPEQQDTAHRFVEQWQASHADRSGQGGEPPDEVTLQGKLLLMAQPMFELQSPTLPGAVTLESYFNIWDLFRPSEKLSQEMRKKELVLPPKAKLPPAAPKSAPPTPAPPTLTSLLAPIPLRAVIARPRTAKDVDALIVSMKVVGMNQLWLDVFSEGKSHLGKSEGEAKGDGLDILTEAVARTRGTGITVMPAVDLLKWAGDAPEEARDLTQLGETSAQAGAYRQRSEAILYQGQSPEEADKQPAPKDLTVSPVSPAVRLVLTTLIQRLAATKGITALVLRETVSLGYDRPGGSHYGVQGDSLGYTPLLRLAFLRRSHVDPLDLEPETYEGQMTANLSLPEFEDWQAMGNVAEDWNGFRAGADLDLLQTLLSAAQQSTGHRIPFLIKQRRPSWHGNWYGLWDAPGAQLPELSEELAYGGSDPDTNYAAFAHTQSRTNLYELERWSAQSKDGLVSALQQMKPGWDGIVLDLTDDAGGDPLAGLVKSLSPPAPKPASKLLSHP